MACGAGGYKSGMRGYQRAWGATCAVIVSIGVGVALLAWPLPGTLLSLALGAGLGATAMACYLDEHARHRHDVVVYRRQVVGAAIAGALAIPGIGGWMVVTVTGALQLLLLAAATSPWAVRLARGLVGSREEASAPPVEAVEAAAPAGRQGAMDLEGVVVKSPSLAEACASFTTPELCLAWHETFRAREGGGPAQDLGVLVLREALMDELERRDPEGLEAWLSSRVPVHVRHRPRLNGDSPDLGPGPRPERQPVRTGCRSVPGASTASTRSCTAAYLSRSRSSCWRR
jgi:hypothetical protein